MQKESTGHWLCICIISAMCAREASADIPERVIDHAFKYVESIKTVEFSANIEDSLTGWASDISYLRDRAKFRAERKDRVGFPVDHVSRESGVDRVTTIKTKQDVVNAYNGEIFQELDLSRSALSIVSDKHPRTLVVGYVPPIELLYAWLIHPSREGAWEQLHDRSSWVKRLAVADARVLPDIDGEEAWELVVPDAIEDASWAYRVILCGTDAFRVLKYIRFSKSTGKSMAEVTVHKYSSIQTEDGLTIPFPQNVSFNQSSDDGKSLPMRLQYSVLASTVKVNSKVEESRFVIPKAAAEHFLDTDEMLKVAPEQSDLGVFTEDTAESPGLQLRGWLVAINIIAVLGLIVLFVVKSVR